MPVVLALFIKFASVILVKLLALLAMMESGTKSTKLVKGLIAVHSILFAVVCAVVMWD